jgi:hypothetical protein
LKDRLGEDEVCKELEKNDEILWNERFSEPFPDDLLGSPPSSS